MLLGETKARTEERTPAPQKESECKKSRTFPCGLSIHRRAKHNSNPQIAMSRGGDLTSVFTIPEAPGGTGIRKERQIMSWTPEPEIQK